MALKTSSPKRRKLLMAARAAQRAVGPGLPPVFVLTDPERMPDPIRVAESLPGSWAMIYRHFGADERERVATALRQVTLERHCRLLIAADPDLALQVGADGVHWPERLRRSARRWTARFSLMTTSSHSRHGVSRIDPSVFQATLVSTVFPSESPSASESMGAIRFRSLVARATIPVFGLGGVSPATAGAIAPVAGLAMVDGAL